MSDIDCPKTAPAPAASPVNGIGLEDGFVPRCPHCDYILIGLTVERCPECGRRFSLAQLRTMHMRRRPTPWDDPTYPGFIVRRYFATWRAMLRPPFFLFLARAESARGALTFAFATLALVAAIWIGVLAIVLETRDGERILFHTLGVPPPTSVAGARGWGGGPPMTTGVAAVLLHVEAVVFVFVSAVLWCLFCRVFLAFGGSPVESKQRRTMTIQVLCYLASWLALGLVAFALGVLGLVVCDSEPPFYVHPEFMLVVINLAEFIVVAVWCCHADAAMRDGLERKSQLIGPFLVLCFGPLAFLAAGLLATAAVFALAGVLS